MADQQTLRNDNAVDCVKSAYTKTTAIASTGSSAADKTQQHGTALNDTNKQPSAKSTAEHRQYTSAIIPKHKGKAFDAFGADAGINLSINVDGKLPLGPRMISGALLSRPISQSGSRKHSPVRGSTRGNLLSPSDPIIAPIGSLAISSQMARRSSTNSLPNRDYILELAHPNRPGATQGDSKR